MAIITTDDLKTHLGIPDTADDANITTAVAAANQWVAEYCGRTFDKTATASATARVYRAFDQCALEVDDFWETSALVVKTDSGDDGTYETTWALNTDFILEPLNGRQHGQPWPYTRIVGLGSQVFPTWSRRPAVQVTAAWGWTAVPPAVKDATVIQAARLFKRKDSVEGIVGGFADFTALRVSTRVDPDVASNLNPYRAAGIVAQVA